MKIARLLFVALLAFGLAFTASCQTKRRIKAKDHKRAQKEAQAATTDSLLLGTWMESHEERGQNGDAKVWRNVKYFKFPPARGREGMTFLPDGKFIYLAIAPTDGTAEQPGRYGWNGSSHIKITLENGRLITLAVKELTKEKLVATEE